MSMSTGERIRRAREARGWTRPDLARIADVAVNTIYRIEAGPPRGKREYRSLARAKIEAALGLSAGADLSPVSPSRQDALREASPAELVAELARRLTETDQPRDWAGPAEFAARPTVAGRRKGEPHNGHAAG